MLFGKLVACVTLFDVRNCLPGNLVTRSSSLNSAGHLISERALLEDYSILDMWCKELHKQLSMKKGVLLVGSVYVLTELMEQLVLKCTGILWLSHHFD